MDQGLRSWRLDEAEFEQSGVPVSDEMVRESLSKDPTNTRTVSKFLDYYNERGHIVTGVDSTYSGSGRVVRFSSKLFLLIANVHVNDVKDEIHTVELLGMHNASGAVGNDPMEGLAGEALALNGLRMLGDEVGLEGTLGFRRLDCKVWQESILKVGPKNQAVREAAGLDRLDLAKAAAGGAVPLNTVLKEKPDGRKSDLVAVCVPEGSDEAVVIRVQVKWGREAKRWLEAARVLASSWDGETADMRAVRQILEQASNLRHIKTWKHVPVWLSAVRPIDAVEIERAGVRLVSGEDFWRMAIPAVRLSVDGLYDDVQAISEEELQALRATVRRKWTYTAEVRRTGR